MIGSAWSVVAISVALYTTAARIPAANSSPAFAATAAGTSPTFGDVNMSHSNGDDDDVESSVVSRLASRIFSKQPARIDAVYDDGSKTADVGDDSVGATNEVDVLLDAWAPELLIRKQALEHELRDVIAALDDLHAHFAIRHHQRAVGSKRAIDFGLNRGYSANQAARHFMGLVASNNAGGPGRRRKRQKPPLFF